MKRRRNGALLALAAMMALAALLAGCSPKTATAPNAPPETYLFIQGQVDTVSHRIHLYWYGTDPDGRVASYEWRLIRSGAPDPPWNPMPATRTDSVFTVFTGDSAVVTPTFEFRARDDDGAVDETPARQQFLLSNLQPKVHISDPFRTTDSTYASVTIHWSTDDPDGGGPGLHYRVWLNGNEAVYDSTDAQTFTVPSARFLQNGPNGPTFLAGLRTVYVRAVDDGGRVGPPDSTRWYVRSPAAKLRNNRGRVLVIDDVPSIGQANSSFDTFYQGALTGTSTRLLADSGSVLRTQFNAGMFRSARDFAQTLRQFEAVVWYRGLETTIAPLVTSYQDSIFAWLDQGGRLYIDGTYLIEGTKVAGAFRETFVNSHLNSDRMYLAYSSALQDSSAGWGSIAGSRFRSSRYPGQISTSSIPGIQNQPPGLRGFVVRDTSQVALWALPDVLDPPNAGFEMPVGMSVPQPGGGHLVLISLPIRSGPPAQANPIFQAIVREVLLP